MVNLNVMTALAICVAGALLEALCAGAKVKSYMQGLEWPSFSPPLWAWYVIGVLYYVIVFVCIYRVLGQRADVSLRHTALTLLLLMVVLNAVWNILFFRAKKLGATFVFSFGYSVVVAGCWYCLIRLDHVAAFALGLYILYLVYASIWMYRLWRLRINEQVVRYV